MTGGSSAAMAGAEAGAGSLNAGSFPVLLHIDCMGLGQTQGKGRESNSLAKL